MVIFEFRSNPGNTLLDYTVQSNHFLVVYSVPSLENTNSNINIFDLHFNILKTATSALRE